MHVRFIDHQQSPFSDSIALEFEFAIEPVFDNVQLFSSIHLIYSFNSGSYTVLRGF